MVMIFSNAACINFGNTEGIDSCFIGNDIEYNLSSKESCNLILDKLNKNPSDKYYDSRYIHFGESTIRLLLGFNRFPHKNKRITNISTPKSQINQIVDNYDYLIKNLPNDTKIISAVTSFPLSIPLIRYFNFKVLQKNSEKFIDIFEEMVDGNAIKNEFKSLNYSINPYICNQKTTSNLLCKKIKMNYNYLEKGDMQNNGTFYKA